MNIDLERKIEMAEALYKYCQIVRRNKTRPEMAGIAGEREMEFKRELDQLLKERAAQPELLSAERGVRSAELGNGKVAA